MRADGPKLAKYQAMAGTMERREQGMKEQEEKEMREKGFTLIELMIVVAIIAVIAAIAIPSLMGARITSNEAVAAAGLRTYSGAQNMFRRSDYESDLIFEYAGNYVDLNTTVAGGQPIRLIDDAFANASKINFAGAPAGAAAPIPKAGYVFIDLASDVGGVTYAVAGNSVAGYGLCGVPETYGRTGRQTFVINVQGTVYQKDLSNNTGTTAFPDTTADKWATTGG